VTEIAVLAPRIVSVGTSNPPRRYTQQEVLDLFQCEVKIVSRFFTNSHIQTRHLVLPEPGEDGTMPDESGEELLAKHNDTSMTIGREAIERCLAGGPVGIDQIDMFTTVSSTGFLCPGLSAIIGHDMGMRNNVHRIDLVGMGCNGGMNGLMAVANWAAANPGHPALLLTCEICSAAYVFDMTVRTGVVNSLFGDGAAAILVMADPDLTAAEGPQVLGFESIMLGDAMQEMRFDFDSGKFNFYLGRDIPYLIGEHVGTPVGNLLKRNGLKTRDIRHWIIHSGGKKVIDAIKYNLGLTEHDVRHTKSILRDYGNLSSAAFLFSYEQLKAEDRVESGDLGVAIAMGPGISIETGLLRW
jgi:3,5-dihydroxyphenylacetyl-CoA synthase